VQNKSWNVETISNLISQGRFAQPDPDSLFGHSWEGLASGGEPVMWGVLVSYTTPPDNHNNLLYRQAKNQRKNASLARQTRKKVRRLVSRGHSNIDALYVIVALVLLSKSQTK